MAKTKSEILAAEIALMLNDLDQFVAEQRQVLQLVEFHFYPITSPLNIFSSSKDILNSLVKSHAIGMSILASCEELRKACATYPVFGAILSTPFIFRSQCPLWWGVKITLPREMEPLIERGYWDTLLYCPDTAEMSNEIDWFEKEDYTSTLSYTMQSAFEYIGRENSGKAIIRHNLDQLALPHFRDIVEKWQKDPDGNDTIPQDPSIVYTKSFAPIENDYIAHAYEKVRRTLRERSLRNYEHLMILWRDYLEELMFANVVWTEAEKKAFIQQWEKNIFGYSSISFKSHNGRWDQTRSISRIDAGKIIKYFIDKFLNKPSKNTKDGETACLLWMLIWFAQDPDTVDITLARVLQLDITSIGREFSCILVDGKEIEISERLYKLLNILREKGSGKDRLLFPDLSKRYLERAIKNASLSLFGSDSAPISPTAFLSFPHPRAGERLTKRQRMGLKDIDPGPVASSCRRQILKVLRESSVKKPFSSI